MWMMGDAEEDGRQVVVRKRQLPCEEFKQYNTE